VAGTDQGGRHTTCQGFALHLENLFSERKIHSDISAVRLYLSVSSLPISLPTLSFGMQLSINFLGSRLFRGSMFLQHRCRKNSVLPLEPTGLLQCLRVLYQVQQYQKTVVKCVSY